MTEKEIEQRFANAGWELDGSFAQHLIVGFTENLSILAYPETWDVPQFQLYDHEKELTCWVQEIPPPRQAAMLLQEHGEPTEEQ